MSSTHHRLYPTVKAAEDELLAGEELDDVFKDTDDTFEFETSEAIIESLTDVPPDVAEQISKQQLRNALATVCGIPNDCNMYFPFDAAQLQVLIRGANASVPIWTPWEGLLPVVQPVHRVG